MSYIYITIKSKFSHGILVRVLKAKSHGESFVKLENSSCGTVFRQFRFISLRLAKHVNRNGSEASGVISKSG